MSKYKKLHEAYNRLANENDSLKSEIETLKKQRTALVNEMSEPIKKTENDVWLALAENIKKSLNQKNIVNMNPDEKDALYYMIERFSQIKPKEECEQRDPFLDRLRSSIMS